MTDRDVHPALRLGAMLLILAALALVLIRIIGEDRLFGGAEAAESEAVSVGGTPAGETAGDAPAVQAATGEDIENYTLFTRVPLGEAMVITGTDFDNSLRRGITDQWCYLARSADGSVTNQLVLARAGADGVPVPSTFDDTALSGFGLDAAAAQVLVHSHCRFRQE